MRTLLLLLLPLAAAAQDVDKTVADLKANIEKYDKNHGGDTIPIEEGFIALRDAKAGAAAAGFLGHPDLGFLAAWAASECGDPAQEGPILAEFRKRAGSKQAEFALFAGAFPTDAARKALREGLAAAKDDRAKDAIRAGLLRARDADEEKSVKDGLADKDPDACAAALRRIGDARRADLAADIAALSRDARTFAKPRRAGIDGAPELKTVGDAALDAASLAVSPATPGIVAWWYENEAAPRFPAGPAGADFLAAWVAAAELAAGKKAPPPEAAVAAVLRELHKSGRDKARVTAVAFGDAWEVTFTLKGKKRTATVAADGSVTLKN